VKNYESYALYKQQQRQEYEKRKELVFRYLRQLLLRLWSSRRWNSSLVLRHRGFGETCCHHLFYGEEGPIFCKPTCGLVQEFKRPVSKHNTPQSHGSEVYNLNCGNKIFTMYYKIFRIVKAGCTEQQNLARKTHRRNSLHPWKWTVRATKALWRNCSAPSNCSNVRNIN